MKWSKNRRLIKRIINKFVSIMFRNRGNEKRNMEEEIISEEEECQEDSCDGGENCDCIYVINMLRMETKKITLEKVDK